MQINYFEILRKNLKKYRNENGYTQEKLSFEAEISADYISEIERGKKIPSIKTLEKIANALKIKIFQLFIN